jgi:hypothetical protein
MANNIIDPQYDDDLLLISEEDNRMQDIETTDIDNNNQDIIDDISTDDRQRSIKFNDAVEVSGTGYEQFNS